MMIDNKTEIFENAALGEKYYRIKHRSGLEIFVFPKDFASCFGVIGVKFGAVDTCFRQEGETADTHLPVGTAHFLEHKMFEKADGVSADEQFAALGADDNAYTESCFTRYLFSATSNFDECLTELLQMVTQPHFTPENVKKERGIIAQEINMYADSPLDRGYENLLRGMYKNCPVRENICGTLKSIEKITDDILRRVCEVFYRPSNMVLSVCGRITPGQVLAVCDRELSAPRTEKKIIRVLRSEPSEVVTAYTECRMKVSRPLFLLGFKDNLPETTDAERRRRGIGMSVLNNMLFSSSGEFYNRLLSERLISPAFSFGYTMTRINAFNYFSGESSDPRRVAALINEKLEAVKRDGLDERDFERCRRVSLAGYIKSFDSVERIADDIVLSSCLNGCEPFAYPEMIDSLTPDYCSALLFEVFDPERQTLSAVLPID